MADGTQTYMFSFGPLSGLADIAAGKPGTQFPNVFNTSYPGPFQPGDPATTDLGATTPSPVLPSQLTFNYNGAVGLAADVANTVSIYDIAEFTNTSTINTVAGCPPSKSCVYVQTNTPLGLNQGDSVVIAHTGAGAFPAPGPYDGTWTVLHTNVTSFPNGITNFGFPAVDNFTFEIGQAGHGVSFISVLTLRSARQRASRRVRRVAILRDGRYAASSGRGRSC